MLSYIGAIAESQYRSTFRALLHPQRKKSASPPDITQLHLNKMSKPTSLLSNVPDAYGILLIRPILLTLSIATLVVYGLTLRIYHTRIAPTGALAPPYDSPLLTINVVTLIPSAISTIWSITHLSLLTHRLLHTYRWRSNSRGLARAPVDDEGGRETSRDGLSSKAVVHPGWVLLADSVCWAFSLEMAVLTGEEAAKWKTGQVTVYGSEGSITRQANLGACPTLDPATGRIDYWCESAWNDVVSLSGSGTSILGTLAYVFVVLASIRLSISFSLPAFIFSYLCT